MLHFNKKIPHYSIVLTFTSQKRAAKTRSIKKSKVYLDKLLSKN